MQAECRDLIGNSGLAKHVRLPDRVAERAVRMTGPQA
jgi:hypothetical protein